MNMTFISILAVFMIAVGVAFIYFIVRENEKPLPQGGVQWAAVVLSGLLVVMSGFLLALTLVPGGGLPAVGPRAEIDKPATNFTFRLVENDRERDLASYKGKVILLNLWATWCAPCLEELPALDRLQKNYADDGFVVLTLSDEPRDVILDYKDLLPEATVTGYIDKMRMPPAFRDALDAGRPSTYIIDRDGYVRRYILGASSYAIFEQLIHPYLGDAVAVR